jgi:hypothetical protein
MPKITQISCRDGYSLLIVEDHKEHDESNNEHNIYVDIISTPICPELQEYDIKGKLTV